MQEAHTCRLLVISVDLSLPGHQVCEILVAELGYTWLTCKQGAMLCSQALNIKQVSQELSAQAGKGSHVGCIEKADARLPEGMEEVEGGGSPGSDKEATARLDLAGL